jgi:hypothetical protein
VCTFTEGYVQGAVHAITGAAVRCARPSAWPAGRRAAASRSTAGSARRWRRTVKEPAIAAPDGRAGRTCDSANVDEQAIIDAVVGIPMIGDDMGLIPAFSVYLANMPADFYNLISIGFVEAMRALGREKAAVRLLVSDAEHCGMNTFRGIMHSPEWDGLIAPMVRDRSDALHAIIAISNALGWGDWHVTAHTPTSLALESRYGYEAVGYRSSAARPSAALRDAHRGGGGRDGAGLRRGHAGGALRHLRVERARCVACGGPSCGFAVERVE